MTKKPNKKRRHRRENPLRRARITNAAMADLGEQIIAIGLGDLILDWAYPRPDGPRIPCLSLSPIKDEDPE